MGRKSVIYPKTYLKSDGRKLISSGPRDLQRVQQTQQFITPEAELIGGLKKQIENLTTQLSNQLAAGQPTGYFSPEEVDAEVSKAVSQAIAEATLEFKKTGHLSDQSVERALQKYKMQIVELQKGNDDLTRMHTTITSQNSDLKKKIEKLNENVKEVVDLKKQIAVLEQAVEGKDELINTLKTRPAIIDGEVIVTDPDRPQMEQVFVDPLEEDAGKDLESHINIEDITPEDPDEVGEKVDKLRDLLGKKLP